MIAGRADAHGCDSFGTRRPSLDARPWNLSSPGRALHKDILTYK